MNRMSYVVKDATLIPVMFCTVAWEFAAALALIHGIILPQELFDADVFLAMEIHNIRCAAGAADELEWKVQPPELDVLNTIHSANELCCSSRPAVPKQAASKICRHPPPAETAPPPPPPPRSQAVRLLTF